MPTTVIGTFEDAKIISKVKGALAKAGFEAEDLEVLEGGKDEIVAEVTERGFGEEDARGYAKAAEGGKKLVALRVAEGKAEQAVAIMERYETETAGGESREGAEEEGEEARVAEVEEELEVGKREVGRGGVRVSTRVSERPVEKTVHLREEKVEAERRPADRALSPEEAEKAFEEKTVEMTGTGEEAEVRKAARVTGEVALNKRVEEREEKVRDKVRRSEVEVEETGPKSSKSR
jgi:stress response protein YsnF